MRRWFIYIYHHHYLIESLTCVCRHYLYMDGHGGTTIMWDRQRQRMFIGRYSKLYVWREIWWFHKTLNEYNIYSISFFRNDLKMIVMRAWSTYDTHTRNKLCVHREKHRRHHHYHAHQWFRKRPDLPSYAMVQRDFVVHTTTTQIGWRPYQGRSKSWYQWALQNAIETGGSQDWKSCSIMRHTSRKDGTRVQ
jgi:hypothetical protein